MYGRAVGREEGGGDERGEAYIWTFLCDGRAWFKCSGGAYVKCEGLRCILFKHHRVKKNHNMQLKVSLGFEVIHSTRL